MTRWIRSVGLASALIGAMAFVSAGQQAAIAAPKDFDHAKLARVVLKDFIRPGYSWFGASIGKLDKAIAALCAKPSRRTLKSTRVAYRAAIVAWGRIEIIMFGPVREKNRFERIFFWPDRSSVGERQIRQIVFGKGERALDPASLAKMSVAVQGLTALEHVLYGKGGDGLATAAAQSRRCRYAKAIADNLGAMTQDILASWQDGGAFARIWLAPGPSNPVYLSPSETTLEITKMLDQGLEGVRDRRIAPAIGLAQNRKVMRPVLWRSKLSMVLIHANIVGLRDLLFQGGLAQAVMASTGRDAETAGMIDSIKSEFRLTERMAAALARRDDPFALPDIQARLIPIGFPLRNIRINAVGVLKAAAGLSIGFNASDGD